MAVVKPVFTELHRQMLLSSLADKERSIRRFQAARPTYNAIFVAELLLVDDLKSMALAMVVSS